LPYSAILLFYTLMNLRLRVVISGRGFLGVSMLDSVHRVTGPPPYSANQSSCALFREYLRGELFLGLSIKSNEPFVSRKDDEGISIFSAPYQVGCLIDPPPFLHHFDS